MMVLAVLSTIDVLELLAKETTGCRCCDFDKQAWLRFLFQKGGARLPVYLII